MDRDEGISSCDISEEQTALDSPLQAAQISGPPYEQGPQLLCGLWMPFLSNGNLARLCTFFGPLFGEKLPTAK